MKKKILIVLLLCSTSAFAQKWFELGTGNNALNADSFINSICSDKFGNIYAGGLFTNSSGRQYVAKWDGTSWAEMGSGGNALHANNKINSICTDTEGNVYAAGAFTNPNGQTYVAKWLFGTTWSELGKISNSIKGEIFSICSSDSGNIYATSTSNNKSCNIYKCDGITWSHLGYPSSTYQGVTFPPLICSDLSGNIYIASNYSFKSPTANYFFFIGKWDGITWTKLIGDSSGLTISLINSFFIDKLGNVYAAGDFTDSLGKGKTCVVKWSGTSWKELGIGSNTLKANNSILSICSDRNGNIYAAGKFLNSNSKRYVAKWNGTTWSEIGSGVNGLNANDDITTLCTDSIGNIYAAGLFTNSNGKQYVAKFGTPLGLNDIANKNNFAIYPNPTNYNFTIQFSSQQKEELAIYNILGEKIYNDFWGPWQTQSNIDVSKFSKGVYIVKIGNEMRKVVIE